MTVIRDKKLKKYCLEKGFEKYSLSTDCAVNLSSELEKYCFDSQGEESFESFFDFCKKINSMYGGKAIVEYSNIDTSIRAELYFEVVEEFSLNINSSTEMVDLRYKDGRLVESYKEVKKISENELSDDTKIAVNNVKKLIRSYPNKK